jgi:heme-degrading monooxygenase HmoA
LNLAQLNVGRLIAPTDDPRVAEFMDALDRVNGIGKRSPGFVWMMEGSGEPGTGNTENSIGGDPRFVANLTVWESLADLEHFVWNTMHRQFFQRRTTWFEPLGAHHFVMWWIPPGHRPTLEEALARLEHLRAHGASDHAFDWAYAAEAGL